MTYEVLEGEQTVYIRPVGFGFSIRSKNNRCGLIDQLTGEEILLTDYALIWHCPTTNHNQVWVVNEQDEMGVFDLIDRQWVAPLQFTEVFPCPEDPYLFTVTSHGKRGTYNALKLKLTWNK